MSSLVVAGLALFLCPQMMKMWCCSTMHFAQLTWELGYFVLLQHMQQHNTTLLHKNEGYICSHDIRYLLFVASVLFYTEKHICTSSAQPLSSLTAQWAALLEAELWSTSTTDRGENVTHSLSFPSFSQIPPLPLQLWGAWERKEAFRCQLERLSLLG